MHVVVQVRQRPGGGPVGDVVHLRKFRDGVPHAGQTLLERVGGFVAQFQPEGSMFIEFEIGDVGERVGQGLGHSEGLHVEQLDRVESQLDKARRGRVGVVEGGEHGETRVMDGERGDGAHRGFGDETERALAAHHELSDHGGWIRKLGERAELVAHRVAHRPQASDGGERLRVLAQAPSKDGEAARDRRLFPAEREVGVGRRGIDDAPIREHRNHRIDGVERILRQPEQPTRGVVGEDAAERGGLPAHRIRPESTSVRA